MPKRTQMFKSLSRKRWLSPTGIKANFWGVFTIASNYAVIATCIIISEYACPRLETRAAWAVYTGMILVISSRLRAFEVLIHEGCHNNIFTKPPAHEWFEFTYTFPVFRLLRPYRSSHFHHHKYFGDPVRDPDVARLVEYGLISDRPISASRKTWLIFGLPFGWLQYENLTTYFAEFWTSSTCYPSKLIYWVVVLAAVHVSRTWGKFGEYYIIPCLGILPIMRWWGEIGEHLGMDMTAHFGNSRINDGFWHRWWLYPHNDGMHAVHHLNGEVPSYRLHNAQLDLMAGSKAYREKNVVAKSMSETFSQFYTRPTIVRERAV
ncbi:fatty acid desaturase-domain-containing protein [Mycena latifolia]|nr:fatty acid desaturase-domain-containing protein [Mycena latifolia]